MLACGPTAFLQGPIVNLPEESERLNPLRRPAANSLWTLVKTGLGGQVSLTSIHHLQGSATLVLNPSAGLEPVLGQSGPAKALQGPKSYLQETTTRHINEPIQETSLNQRMSVQLVSMGQLAPAGRQNSMLDDSH